MSQVHVTICILCRHFLKEIVRILGILQPVLSRMGSTLLKNISRVKEDEGPINILNIDTLLVVFNYLSLYDKLVAMRVSKKWHHIIQNHGWTVIDFRDKCPNRKVEDSKRRYRRFVSKKGRSIFEYRDCDLDCGNEWRFPSHKGLEFLGFYAGKSLKAIYFTLDLLNDEIVGFLRVNCPNIETLGIIQSFYRYPKTLYFPPKLQRLDLTGLWTDYLCSHHGQSDQIRPWLEKCPNLEKITLRCLRQISFADMKKLSEMTRLRQIELISCTFIDNIDTLLRSMAHWTHLKVLTLRGVTTDYRRNDINSLLRSMANWTHLKELKLRGVIFTDEAFEMAIPGILNLEILELGGTCVTSLVVILIGIHLRKLKSLTLTSPRSIDSWPRPRYSCDSLQALSYHHELEHLEIHQPNNREEKDERERWVRQIYDVLVTLPKITNVKMLGVEILFCFRNETYPVFKYADIEVVDQKKYYTDLDDIDIESEWRIGQEEKTRNKPWTIFNRFFKTT
ncbi:uncharacterized protein [Amphiura filiformis]|uniref:uncharacterized protein n=1 Tax=Amphiura filiformis TaxID=82378 RepID=UPI003B2194D0